MTRVRIASARIPRLSSPRLASSVLASLRLQASQRLTSRAVLSRRTALARTPIMASAPRRASVAASVTRRMSSQKMASRVASGLSRRLASSSRTTASSLHASGLKARTVRAQRPSLASPQLGRAAASMRPSVIASAFAGKLSSGARDLVEQVRTNASAVDPEQLMNAVERRIASARVRLAASPVNTTEVVASRMVRRLLSARLQASLAGIEKFDQKLASTIRTRVASKMPTADTSVKDVLGQGGEAVAKSSAKKKS